MEMVMERQRMLKQGGALLRLPPGFRFHPTDEELVLHYLRRKVFSVPLPALVIPEIDLAKYSPWDLPGGTSEDKYFFYIRDIRTNYVSKWVTGFGYWKVKGKEKTVIVGGRSVAGIKRTMVFYQGRRRTEWVMHEYRLAAEKRGCVRDWVLCVFPKRKGDDDDGMRMMDLVRERRRSPSPASSESSCVTDGGEEETVSGGV